MDFSLWVRELLRSQAKRYRCAYLNMSAHIRMSPIDGLHIDEQDQEKFAKLFAKPLQYVYNLQTYWGDFK